MKSRWQKEKEAVIRTAQEMARKGLVTGTSGNVSLRLAPLDGRPILAITPTHKAYDTLLPDDIVVLDFDVDSVEGELTPSSETLLHIAVYRARPDVGAILHTHSTFATVLAVAGLEIPPIIDEMAVFAGDTIKVTDYAFSGTEELAENATKSLGQNNAVILRNHGMLGAGKALEDALDMCLMVERGAQVLVHATLLGKVNPIPHEAREAAKAIFEMRSQLERP